MTTGFMLCLYDNHPAVKLIYIYLLLYNSSITDIEHSPNYATNLPSEKVTTIHCCIYCHSQTVSLYHNTLVWLDKLELKTYLILCWISYP